MSDIMRPGQDTPNEFELAILCFMAREHPTLTDIIPRLRVLRRDYTGAGSFTYFHTLESVPAASSPISIAAEIMMPGLKYGMDALLFIKEGNADCLEIYTCGNEKWDGIYDGYSFVPIP